MLATETLAKNRAPQCNPANHVSSIASSAAPTSSQDLSASGDNDEPSTTVKPTTTHVATTSAHSVTPTSTHITTSTKASAPAATFPAGSGDNGPFTGGQATFFFQNNQAGACGTVHPDSALIAALQTVRYGNLGDASPNCGRQIKLTNNNNGKSIEVTVADACPTCENENDLDLSVGAFTQIATEDEGEVPITWSFLD